jgi:hypothetical protein
MARSVRKPFQHPRTCHQKEAYLASDRQMLHLFQELVDFREVIRHFGINAFRETRYSPEICAGRESHGDEIAGEFG